MITALGFGASPLDQSLVPALKTIAPLGCQVYFTACEAAGCPGGGETEYARPSSCSQLMLLLVWKVVFVSATTPGGCLDRYWLWVGIASHSQPTRFEPIVLVEVVEIPVLRQMRSPEYWLLASAGGIVSG